MRESGPRMLLSALLVVASLGGMVDRASAESSFTDKKRQFRLSLPASWKSDADMTIQDFSFIKGPSGASLLIISSPRKGTPQQEIEAKRAALEHDHPELIYRFGPITDAHVGNEEGKSFEATSVPKDQPRAKPAGLSSTIVNHNNTQYEFIFQNLGKRQRDRDEIFRSVTFL